VVLPSIRYGTITKLVSTISTLLTEPVEKKLLSINHDNVNDFLTFTLASNVTLTFSNDIALLLGFGDDTVLKETTKGRVPININFRSNTIFVNCSFVTPSIVSHTYNRIIRTLPNDVVPSGSLVYKSLLDRHYYDIEGDTLTTVRIQLRNEYGDLLPLADSTIATWLTLSFKNGNRYS
jgi:hypothetical protein